MSKAGDAMGGLKVSCWRPGAVQCGDTEVSVIQDSPSRDTDEGWLYCISVRWRFDMQCISLAHRWKTCPEMFPSRTIMRIFETAENYEYL